MPAAVLADRMGCLKAAWSPTWSCRLRSACGSPRTAGSGPTTARRPNLRVEGDRGHSRTIQETGELFAKAMNVAAGPKQMTDSLYRARC